MYDGVYNGMVRAGIPVKLEEEIMYNKIGEVSTNKEEMYGRPTKYKITNPEYLLFVDKTGCNTNMKVDGYAGGQLSSTLRHYPQINQGNQGNTIELEDGN
jgi:hypothetical protein